MAKFTAQQLLDHLYTQRLPEIYRIADLETDKSLYRYLQSLIEGGFSIALEGITNLVDITDPLKCPQEFFPYLFESFGYKYSEEVPIINQRNILNSHGELFSKRGTVQYVELLSRMLTGYNCVASIQRNETTHIRELYVNLLVDEQIPQAESEELANRLEKYLTEGYVPFYLDVKTRFQVTNVIIGERDATQSDYPKNVYSANVLVSAQSRDITPLKEISVSESARERVSMIENTLKGMPFSEFRIYGCSSIVPLYIYNNVINPNLLNVTTQNGNITSIIAPNIFIPKGNKLYFTITEGDTPPNEIRVSIGDFDYEIYASQFIEEDNVYKYVLDVSEALLADNSIYTGYYVTLEITAPESETSIHLWYDDYSLDSFFTPNQFQLDFAEKIFYNSNTKPRPIYTVSLFGASGGIYFPYTNNGSAEYPDGTVIPYDDNMRYAFYSNGEHLNMQRVTGSLTDIEPTRYIWSSRKSNSPYKEPFIVCYDCSSAVWDNEEYKITLRSNETLTNPIVTVLISNKLGGTRLLTATFDSKSVDTDGMQTSIYTFDLPQGYYAITMTVKIQDTTDTHSVSSIDYDVFWIENVWVLPSSVEKPVNLPFSYKDIYLNKISVNIGLDGLNLLGYNDTERGEYIADYFDVLTAKIHRRVGVNYNSNNVPVSFYPLPQEVIEDVTEDLDGDIFPVNLTTFGDRTFICFDTNAPRSIEGNFPFYTYKVKVLDKEE